MNSDQHGRTWTNMERLGSGAATGQHRGLEHLSHPEGAGDLAERTETHWLWDIGDRTVQEM